MADEAMQGHIVWTAHARERAARRGLDPAWVEATIRQPDWTVGDPGDPALIRAYRRLPERGRRVLRVVCSLSVAGTIRIVTAFLDRDATPPA